VILNGTSAQTGSFNITGNGTIGGVFRVDGPVEARAPWGLNALVNGLMIMPEGTIVDDGAGKLTLTGPLIVMNPGSGSYIRVAQGEYTLPAWGYLTVDLPPTSPRGSVVAPVVRTWSDTDRAYDARDRLVLAQRAGAGGIFLRIQPSVRALPAPSTLMAMVGPNLGDFRNNAQVSAALTWWTIPNRTLTYVKQFPNSRLRITYQDTLGTLGQFYAGCEWRILVDNAQVGFFSDADLDTAAPSWRMNNAAHVVWATPAAGVRTITVQNRGNRGAWGAGTDSCLQGWNTSSNFLSVEEIP
jgi:hypothetical protein